MAGTTYLAVPFAQKDKAKALGARWDSAQRQWYVPAGLDLVLFADWLPAKTASAATAPAASQPLEVAAPSMGAGPIAAPAGISLSQLLAGVERAVAQAYQQGIWTRVDVVNVTVRNRHVYLELSERDESGAVLAQARGAIWARTAERVVPAFERATGAQLAPGIKLLVLAKPVFKAQYGFSLDIADIDPSYTLGDLEAQKRKIRAQLQEEGIFDRNRAIKTPWDFYRVLVIAPPGAAGLGDFDAEAKRLHASGVCIFEYAYSRFQGPGSAVEILAAAQAAMRNMGDDELDAVIIIRGGGAVNDLAWLNDYELAKFVCLCRAPVLTGIGHERDSTVLDEVAHRSFDTPSKVIAAVEKQIVARVRQVQQDHQWILTRAKGVLERVASRAERTEADIRATARSTIAAATSKTEAGLQHVQLNAKAAMRIGRSSTAHLICDVSQGSKRTVVEASKRASRDMASVKLAATSAVRLTNAQLRTLLPSVLDRARRHARQARADTAVDRQKLLERAQQSIKAARMKSEGLMREVAGQGPSKTLSRGFAVVKAGGKAVTSASAAKKVGDMQITFSDGEVKATVVDKFRKGEEK